MTGADRPAFLMAYFHPEDGADGEQIRFAVSEIGDATRWTPLNASRPVLVSSVGELGARDPYLIRDHVTNRFVLIATDLRVHPDHDWDRAVRHGSRDLLVWESDDLLDWSGPRARTVSPPEAGNTWAPKAFWSADSGSWVVIWASALYEADRAEATHQRLLAANTSDFVTFTDQRVYLDPGHDVIDATFLHTAAGWYRFSANAQAPGSPADIGHHIFVELGDGIDDPSFRPVTVDLGGDQLQHAEGPAVFQSATSGAAYLLMDENGLRGYQLFTAALEDIPAGRWQHLPDAQLPPFSRHGSVIPISVAERSALLSKLW